jgi:hypothetical protein
MKTPDCYTHVWEQYGEKYIALKGHTVAVVRVNSLHAGYLWQFGKKYGHAATLELAKDWVETLAEHFSIPAKDRWVSL